MTTALPLLLGIKRILQLLISSTTFRYELPLWQYKRKIKVKTTLTKKEELSKLIMQKFEEIQIYMNFAEDLDFDTVLFRLEGLTTKTVCPCKWIYIIQLIN